MLGKNFASRRFQIINQLYLVFQSAGTKKEEKKKGKKGEEKGRVQSAQGKKPQQQQRKKPELVDIVIQDIQELKVEGRERTLDQDPRLQNFHAQLS